MLGESLTIATALFAVLLNMAMAYVLVARHGSGALVAGERTEGSGAPVDSDDGVVECPNCGTANEVGYRYCRDCVSELPVSMSFHSDGTDSVGRVLP